MVENGDYANAGDAVKLYQLACAWGLENCILLIHVELAYDFTNSQTFWRLRLIKVYTDQTLFLPLGALMRSWFWFQTVFLRGALGLTVG